MKPTIGLGLMRVKDVSPVEQVRMLHAAGFTAIFSGWRTSATPEVRKVVTELGMVYQSIHAPFVLMNHLWRPSQYTQRAKDELLACVEDCARYEVPLMVIHPYIGFDREPPRMETMDSENLLQWTGSEEEKAFGIANYQEVVDAARKAGVKLAFENVEGAMYLKVLMDAFKAEEHVGFCWDSGHEMCYNYDVDLLGVYGDRLFGTHLNDNRGIRGDTITFQDDLHLIPGDGNRNWVEAICRLQRSRPLDCLMFELKIDEAIDAQIFTDYSEIPFKRYLTRVMDAAERIHKAYLS